MESLRRAWGRMAHSLLRMYQADKKYSRSGWRIAVMTAHEKPLSIHEIIRQHHSALVAWLMPRIRVPEDAQDIAQETYLRMMKYEQATDVHSPLALLHRIAMNVAHDLDRHQRVRHYTQHVDVDELAMTDDSPSLERVLDSQENYRLVCQAIESLTPRCRQVFLLSRVNCLSYPDIAVACGISVKMVEKHISHALYICMQALEE